MRLLFLINIDMSAGGPSVHLLNDIMFEAKRRGHHITRIEKIYGESNSWKLDQEEKDSEVIFRFHCMEPRKMNYSKRYLSDIKYASLCRKCCNNLQFDCIFLQSCNTAAFQLLWIKKKKCCIIYNVQDIFPLDIAYEHIMREYNPLYLIMDALQKYAYKKSSLIITISEDMKNTLQRIGVDEKKIYVIHNWAYKAEYKKEEERLIFDEYFNNGRFNVVYAGNIGIAQSVETLINAAQILQKYSEIQVLIFGNGSRIEKCKKMISELGLGNIRLYGLLPQQYSQYIYRLADINIVTLIKGIMNTSLPSKTASCYNSRKPVVYCVEDKCITLKTMQENNSQIYNSDPEDAEQLSNTILRIYSNSKHSQKKEIEFLPYEQIMLPQSAEEYINYIELFCKNTIWSLK